MDGKKGQGKDKNRTANGEATLSRSESVCVQNATKSPR